MIRTERMWYAGLYTDPVIVTVEVDQDRNDLLWCPDEDCFYHYRELFLTEKEAISYARKLCNAEIDRLTKRVAAFDDRYDDIEESELAAEGESSEVKGGE